jgi:hypothetical protein
MTFGEQAEHCSDTMCLFLPMGYALLTADLCVDLPWVLFPSKTTANNLRRYYTFILTPSLYTPGYWWPVFATYVFLAQCPDVWNWVTFWLFVPIAYRYSFILNHPEDPRYAVQLNHWWTIVVIRLILYMVTFHNLRNRGCAWSDYSSHAESLYQRLFVLDSEVAPPDM